MNSLSKKIISFLTLSLFFLLLTSGSAQAQFMLKEFAGNAGYPTGESANLTSVTQTVINAVLSLVGIIFLGFALYSGIRWMSAHGNEENVTKAKDTLQAAIIGMVVVSIAYAVTTLVFKLVPVGT
ncbi:MAG: hypothetical protein ACD_72C00390G0001, partial [uncultured bacterium]